MLTALTLRSDIRELNLQVRLGPKLAVSGRSHLSA
jgi:hypothetical protein